MSININSTQISALLQLYPMAIPGAVENLQPPGAYHLGIPESIHSPSTKLFMVIDPVTLFSTSFAAGDSVRLWVNSQATSVIKPIKPGEENDRIFMELPWGVLKDGHNTLYYEVTRVSGNKDQSTPILNVLFNNPVASVTVTHPASIVLGQPAIVTITVSYTRPYDDVTLTIGTWSITFTNFDHTKPIIYPLTTTDLQQIGDGTHPVSAMHRDQLSNSSVSPTTFINIDVTRAPLEIDNSLLELHAVKFLQSYGWSSNKVPGNFAFRPAKEGVPPYIYTPDDPSIVSVTPTGEVTGLRNGTTTVRVTDRAGATVFYIVSVRNVYRVIKSIQNYPGTLDGKAVAHQWIRSVGGISADSFDAWSLLTHANLFGNFSDVQRQVFDGLTVDRPLGKCFASHHYDTHQGVDIGINPHDGTLWVSSGYAPDQVFRAIAFVPA